MLAYSVADKAAIESHSYTDDARVTVDLSAVLPGSPYNDVTLGCKTITIQGDTTTDAPPGSRLQPGYSARQATIVLSGQVDARDASKSVAWLFGQYSKTSPLYRKRRLYLPVTVDRGVYVPGKSTPDWFRRFTGRVDGVSVDAATGDVTLRCVDNRNKLRAELSIPAVVTEDPFNAGLTSECAIDAILRAATSQAVSSWPAQRLTPAQGGLYYTLFAAGYRASLWAEESILDQTLLQPSPAFAPGVFGSALSTIAPDPTGWSTVVYDVTHEYPGTVGTKGFQGGFNQLFFEAWVNVGTGTNSVIELTAGGAADVIALAITATQGVQVSWTASGDAGPTVSPSTGALSGKHYVAGYVSLPLTGDTTGGFGTVYIDGTAFPFTLGATAHPRLGNPLNLMLVGVQPGGTIEAVQVFYNPNNADTAIPARNNGFVPQAVIDPSLNPLVVVPAVDGDPWQALQQIAAAEQGVCGFIEDGTFRFYNRTTLKGGVSVRDITSKQALIGLTTEESASGLINHAKADYTTWEFGAAAWVWQSSAKIKVPKGNFVTINAAPTDGTLWTEVDTTPAKLPTPGGTPGNTNYLVAGNKSGSAEFNGTLTFVITQVASNQVQITIFNNSSSQDAWLVCPASYTGPVTVGTPVLYIGAVPVTQSDTIDVDAQNPATIDPQVGDVLYTFPSNLWRQDQDATQALVNDAVTGGNVVRPTFENIPVFPDPRLQLTDRVHIVDDDASGTDEYIQLWNSAEIMAYGDWSMSISGTAIARPGGWILGVQGRSELGVTTFI